MQKQYKIHTFNWWHEGRHKRLVLYWIWTTLFNRHQDLPRGRLQQPCTCPWPSLWQPWSGLLWSQCPLWCGIYWCSCRWILHQLDLIREWFKGAHQSITFDHTVTVSEVLFVDPIYPVLYVVELTTFTKSNLLDGSRPSTSFNGFNTLDSLRQIFGMRLSESRTKALNILAGGIGEVISIS